MRGIEPPYSAWEIGPEVAPERGAFRHRAGSECLSVLTGLGRSHSFSPRCGTDLAREQWPKPSKSSSACVEYGEPIAVCGRRNRSDGRGLLPTRDDAASWRGSGTRFLAPDVASVARECSLVRRSPIGRVQAFRLKTSTASSPGASAWAAQVAEGAGPWAQLPRKAHTDRIPPRDVPRRGTALSAKIDTWRSISSSTHVRCRSTRSRLMASGRSAVPASNRRRGWRRCARRRGERGRPWRRRA